MATLPNDPLVELLKSLPQELTENIFQQIPIKYLIRLTCVSKSSSLFTQNLHRRLERKSIVIAVDIGKYSTPCLHKIDAKGLATVMCEPVKITNTSDSSFYDEPNFKICNGLICSYFKSEVLLRVCNPATGEVVTLPKNSSSSCEYCLHYYQFGFDPTKKEYKVLAWNCLNEFQIYTLGTKSWRPMQHVPSTQWRKSFSTGESFYWHIIGKEDTTLESFNLSKEEFGVVCSPKLVKHQVEQVFAIDGSLCLLSSHWPDKEIKLWMLRENSKNAWVMMKSIVLPFGIRGGIEANYNGCGEVVLGASRKEPCRICVYDLLTHRLNMTQVSLSEMFYFTTYTKDFACLTREAGSDLNQDANGNEV